MWIWIWVSVWGGVGIYDGEISRDIEDLGDIAMGSWCCCCRGAAPGRSLVVSLYAKSKIVREREVAIAVFIRNYVPKLKEKEKKEPSLIVLTPFSHFLNFTISSLKSRSFPFSINPCPISPPPPLIPQPQQDIRATPALSPAARKIRHVRITRKRLRDLLRRLNATDLDQAIASLIDSPRDGLRRLGLALGADDGGLALLLGLLDDEARALCVLLRNLLLLNGLGEFAPERHMRDGNVFEGDVEFLRTLEKVGTDAVGYLHVLACV